MIRCLKNLNATLLVDESVGLDAAHRAQGAEFADLDDDLRWHAVSLRRLQNLLGARRLVKARSFFLAGAEKRY
jgi:hypothetical protein